ncbi:hypothetical protein BCT41_16235 [Vibrio splendidus]|uniref:hypothetical protein n=2 Tax=Vibrio TaxID=662 RepID=UPI0002D7C5C0|nr:hypothetical protein [Vibrio splendidus]OEF17297.1 hypothetical protein A145_14870 [Vibrio splendidus 5S-101]PMM96143.1 hypothetical protein BCT41_16235 [Vibrio splendidus]SBS64290.1 hypothetical protein VHE8714_02157 [Vibrio splendidus]
MLDLNKAKLSESIQQATAANDAAVTVRRIQKNEIVQLGSERLDLPVITEKTKLLGQMYATESHHLVMGEVAQKALFNDLKMKTFIPAVNQYGEQFITILNAPSPNGYTCGYYETTQHSIPELQKGYGQLVNDQENKCYRLEMADLPPFTGEFPSLEEALSEQYKNATIQHGNEEVLVRLGKTFTLASKAPEETSPTPTTLSTLDDEVDDDEIDIDLDVDLDSIDPLDALLG